MPCVLKEQETSGATLEDIGAGVGGGGRVAGDVGHQKGYSLHGKEDGKSSEVLGREGHNLTCISKGLFHLQVEHQLQRGKCGGRENNGSVIQWFSDLIQATNDDDFNSDGRDN